MENKPNNIDSKKDNHGIDWHTIRNQSKTDKVSPVVITICTMLTGVLIAVIVSYLFLR